MRHENTNLTRTMHDVFAQRLIYIETSLPEPVDDGLSSFFRMRMIRGLARTGYRSLSISDGMESSFM